MRLGVLESLPSFALLGPGFDGRRWVLLTELVPAAPGAPLGGGSRLALAGYATPAAEASWFDGRCERFDEVAIDPAPGGLAPELDDAGFASAVERIREAIASGDVYQVNLTLRARLPRRAGSELAAALCRRGVPPYFAWVRLPGGLELVSASPELLFAIDGLVVRSEPMKGTARPGALGELETSAKDEAELAMITDLVRHDLTPVCEPRSVRVVTPRRFVHLPYAVQTVSVVEGKLLAGRDARDVLAAIHPGGSVTGAPKRAAVRMIAELESTPRGVYCGALGWCAGARAIFSLLIRTAARTADGWVYGVGGGIVYDSDPRRELEEVHVKLGALGCDIRP